MEPLLTDHIGQYIMQVMTAVTQCLKATTMPIGIGGNADTITNTLLDDMLSAHGQDAMIRKVDPVFRATVRELTRAVALVHNQLEAAETRRQEAEAHAMVGLEHVLCRMCYKRLRNATAMPCRHSAYCSKCLHAVKKQGDPCPACRIPISEILEYYLHVEQKLEN